jgi:hypothetical protein
MELNRNEKIRPGGVAGPATGVIGDAALGFAAVPCRLDWLAIRFVSRGAARRR